MAYKTFTGENQKCIQVPLPQSKLVSYSVYLLFNPEDGGDMFLRKVG
jgi:hypothetical protein